MQDAHVECSQAIMNEMRWCCPPSELRACAPALVTLREHRTVVCPHIGGLTSYGVYMLDLLHCEDNCFDFVVVHNRSSQCSDKTVIRLVLLGNASERVAANGFVVDAWRCVFSGVMVVNAQRLGSDALTTAKLAIAEAGFGCVHDAERSSTWKGVEANAGVI